MAKNTESEYIILLLYYGKFGYANAHQSYVKLILTLFFLYLHIPVTESRSSNLAGHFTPQLTITTHTQHPLESNGIICCLLFFSWMNAIESDKTSVTAVG